MPHCPRGRTAIPAGSPTQSRSAARTAIRQRHGAVAVRRGLFSRDQRIASAPGTARRTTTTPPLGRLECLTRERSVPQEYASAVMSAPRYTLSRKEPQETGSEQKSYVKPELHHVAVAHDVVFAFHAHPAGRLRRVHGAGCHQFVKRNDLGFDETALEVGMDDAGSLGGRRSLGNRPCPCCLRTGRQGGLKPKRVETGTGQSI